MRLHYAGPEPEPIGILLLPRFAMVALFSAIEPLRIANRMAGRELFRWHLIGLDGAPVTASNGMSLGVELALAQAPDFPSLAVCASFAPEAALTPALLGWLRERAARGCVLGGMDTGCVALAAAGLLDDRTVTLHWESLPDFRRRFPRVDAVESLYEVDARGFSCAGGSAAIDMALDLVRRRHGEALAARVNAQLVHARGRLPASRQRPAVPPHLPLELRRAIGLMEANLESPLAIADLARRLALSWRGLERLFLRYLACSPRDHYLGLRLDHAHGLLLETSHRVLEIAQACGFASASSFTRAFRQRHGLTPSQLRRQQDRAWLSNGA
ncbi:GlxA family transcriptional regulator [Halomonas sp. 328]|uniref:GlxA family transcriptional regulator n=1 Tax=Halomonas sp. 328 TaxID=2776704 RepID=UPI0018A7DA9C|nr:GlxA family transcriptional regulator [Halomonas sp. 328]MBF8223184.1 GlxA family transcriptional regulator [Halomonas sp. 328]